jgi:hypothetical protein
MTLLRIYIQPKITDAYIAASPKVQPYELHHLKGRASLFEGKIKTPAFGKGILV